LNWLGAVNYKDVALLALSMFRPTREMFSPGVPLAGLIIST
jgi:hypothetical protein